MDVTEKLKPYLAKRSAAPKSGKDEKKQNKSKTNTAVAIAAPCNKVNSTTKSVSPPPPPPQSRPTEKTIELRVELENNDECNISHISITVVIKKSTIEVSEFKSIFFSWNLS